MRVHYVGPLADKYGTEHLTLKVRTPMQLFRGLECNVEGWEAEMRNLADTAQLSLVTGNGKEDGYKNIGPDALHAPFEDDVEDVYVVAALRGTGLEIAAFSFMGIYGWAGIAAAVVFNIAVGFVVGAITQALSPSPDASSGSERPDERASFIFNGPVNTTVQGGAVPLVYGRVLTGSTVMSAGIYVEEMIK